MSLQSVYTTFKTKIVDSSARVLSETKDRAKKEDYKYISSKVSTPYITNVAYLISFIVSSKIKSDPKTFNLFNKLDDDDDNNEENEDVARLEQLTRGYYFPWIDDISKITQITTLQELSYVYVVFNARLGYETQPWKTGKEASTNAQRYASILVSFLKTYLGCVRRLSQNNRQAVERLIQKNTTLEEELKTIEVALDAMRKKSMAGVTEDQIEFNRAKLDFLKKDLLEYLVERSIDGRQYRSDLGEASMAETVSLMATLDLEGNLESQKQTIQSLDKLRLVERDLDVLKTKQLKHVTDGQSRLIGHLKDLVQMTNKNLVERVSRELFLEETKMSNAWCIDILAFTSTLQAQINSFCAEIHKGFIFPPEIASAANQLFQELRTGLEATMISLHKKLNGMIQELTEPSIRNTPPRELDEGDGKCNPFSEVEDRGRAGRCWNGDHTRISLRRYFRNHPDEQIRYLLCCKKHMKELSLVREIKVERYVKSRVGNTRDRFMWTVTVKNGV